MKDFFDGKSPLAAWGRIERDMKMVKYYYKNEKKDQADKLKDHVKSEIERFKEVYGNRDLY